MVKNSSHTARRDDALSRERIIEAAITLLDRSGESGLTFRALAEALATGPGAIYWHVANKDELLTAVSDTIVAGAMTAPLAQSSPQEIVRAVALAIFDCIDQHPWVGAALTRTPGALPSVRILEPLGQQVRALGVPAQAQWRTVSSLLSYILGVSAQHAANARIGRERGADRDLLLSEVAQRWQDLDAAHYPFTRSIAGQLARHNDREDFLAGIDLILDGIGLQPLPQCWRSLHFPHDVAIINH